MRVLLDATYPHRAPHSGTAVYIARLTPALERQGVEVEIVGNSRRGHPAGGGAGSARNLFADWMWTSWELPRLARRMRADVVHHPLPAWSQRAGRPQVITVHDLAFERLPGCFDRSFRTYARHSHRAAARAASAVICVSRTTAADVEELWGIEAGRIVVAPHGPGQQLPMLRTHADRAEHFLYVGDAEPRKNLGVLIDAYGRYRQRTSEPLPLILAGSAVAAGPGVTVVSTPGQRGLAQLYAGAAALILPSLYEGFGLTALEAMASGAPVIASDIAGLREICGDAAEYIDPHEPDSLAATMTRLAGEPRLRDELSRRGIRRASQFSWESSARAHVEAYSLALARR